MTTTRKYDLLNRLTEISSAPSGTNSTISTIATLSGTSQTNTGNLFLPKTPEGFSYDDDGNMTGDGRWIYSWDGENRLKSLESYSDAPTASKQKLEFEYDHQGRRIQKIVSTHNGSSWVAQSTNRFVHDGWNLVAEFTVVSGANSLTRVYAWGTDLSGSMQGAGGVGGLLMVRQVSGTSGTHFAAYDGNGNVTGLVSASNGNVSANYEYDPFGQTIRATGDMALLNPFRFSTKYTDGESGFLYYGYRYYDPNPGRWVNRDPIEEEGGPGLFIYIGNNAISFVDVIGLRGACVVNNPFGFATLMAEPVGDPNIVYGTSYALTQVQLQIIVAAGGESGTIGPIPVGETWFPINGNERPNVTCARKFKCRQKCKGCFDSQFTVEWEGEKNAILGAIHSVQHGWTPPRFKDARCLPYTIEVIMAEDYCKASAKDKCKYTVTCR
jgi:RHS repeat-associated protein